MKRFALIGLASYLLAVVLSLAVARAEAPEVPDISNLESATKTLDGHWQFSCRFHGETRAEDCKANLSLCQLNAHPRRSLCADFSRLECPGVEALVSTQTVHSFIAGKPGQADTQQVELLENRAPVAIITYDHVRPTQSSGPLLISAWLSAPATAPGAIDRPLRGFCRVDHP